jgi:hypothetical protein
MLPHLVARFTQGLSELDKEDGSSTSMALTCSSPSLSLCSWQHFRGHRRAIVGTCRTKFSPQPLS